MYIHISLKGSLYFIGLVLFFFFFHLWPCVRHIFSILRGMEDCGCLLCLFLFHCILKSALGLLCVLHVFLLLTFQDVGSPGCTRVEKRTLNWLPGERIRVINWTIKTYRTGNCFWFVLRILFFFIPRLHFATDTHIRHTQCWNKREEIRLNSNILRWNWWKSQKIQINVNYKMKKRLMTQV